jgi:hypothetical protein
MSKIKQIDKPTNPLYYKQFTVPALKQQIKQLPRIFIHEYIQNGLSRLNRNETISILKKYYYGKHICRFIYTRIYLFFKKRIHHLQESSRQHRLECINETDFYTLEPLCNIPENQFFCFLEKGFYYGFSIFSLKRLMSSKSHLRKYLNPYTRENIEINIQHTIISILRLLSIVEPTIREKPIDFVPIRNLNRFMGNSIYPNSGYLSNEQIQLVEWMKEKRNRSLDQRIETLFYEIDLLGNYTQRKWFDDLDRHELVRLFNRLEQFWRNDDIPNSLRWDICSLTGDPFYNITIHQTYSTDQISEACIIVMENMTYLGKDNDSKQIGVIYILLNLAKVSFSAMESIPWLNEY